MAVQRQKCERREQAKKFSHYECAAATVGSKKGGETQTHLQARYLPSHFNRRKHNAHRKAHCQPNQDLLPQHKKSLWRGRLDLWQRSDGGGDNQRDHYAQSDLQPRRCRHVSQHRGACKQRENAGKRPQEGGQPDVKVGGG